MFLSNCVASVWEFRSTTMLHTNEIQSQMILGMVKCNKIVEFWECPSLYYRRPPFHTIAAH